MTTKGIKPSPHSLRKVVCVRVSAAEDAILDAVVERLATRGGTYAREALLERLRREPEWRPVPAPPGRPGLRKARPRAV